MDTEEFGIRLERLGRLLQKPETPLGLLSGAALAAVPEDWLS